MCRRPPGDEHGVMNETTDTTAGPPGDAAGTSAPTAAAPPPAAPRPPLRRSATDRKIAGVAGGLGRYFGIDPLIFRVVLVTLAVFGGSGLLLYAVGWLLIPEDGEQESEAGRLINGRATAKVIGAVILAIVGLIAVGNFARTNFGFGGFAALVAIGIAWYLISRDGNHRPVVPPRNPPPAPAAPGAYGQTTGTAYAASGSGDAPTTTLPPVPPSTGVWYSPPPPPAPRPPRSPLGRVTASLAVLTAGLLVSWNVATHHDVPAEVVLACCLAVVGIGLVVGAFVGRGRGLIILGAFLALATTAATVVGTGGFSGGVGTRTWAPRTVAGVHDTYRLGVGESTLDLSHLRLADGQSVDVRLRQGIGDVLILLPPAAPVDVDSEVHAGVIMSPRGADRNGTSLHRRYVDPRDGAVPAITIDADLGVGSLEVRRATS